MIWPTWFCGALSTSAAYPCPTTTTRTCGTSAISTPREELKNPACIVDANHNNSNKQFKEQIRIVKEVLHSRILRRRYSESWSRAL